MSTQTAVPDKLGSTPLEIAVVSPNERHRNQAIGALNQFPNSRIREFISYPPDTEAAAQLLRQEFDVVIVDLDSSPEYAVGLVRNICVGGATNVIVYSSRPNPELLLRCMRAGAREFLPMPISSSEMADALARVSSRRLEMPTPISKVAKPAPPPVALGKLLVFMSAKGGAGVTTLACSLGVSLAHEFGQRTLLIDLNFPLGDAALSLGLRGQYSTVDAMESAHRLDGSLLVSLLTQHESGLLVLPAPSEMTSARLGSDAVFKLLRVARQEFEYVIVDAGSRPDVENTFALDDSMTVYLVTQIGIPELRNSNRLIRQMQTEGGPRLEIVVNRSGTESEGIEEAQVAQALTRQVDWRIPNDYAAVRRMQNLATPLTQDDTQIARAIRQMGESLTGQTVNLKKKKVLRFF